MRFQSNDAYSRGYKAFYSHKSHASNPFMADTLQHQEWARGFDAANIEMFGDCYPDEIGAYDYD